MLLQSADRDGLRSTADREIRRESSSPHTFKQHRSSLSSGSVESRMAELDDIQRSMEVEETEEEGFEEDRFKREHYDTDSDSVSSGREGASYTQHSARVQSQQPPSPVEQAYINNNVSGIDNRIPAHEWTFEEQFKQVSPDVVPNLKLFDFLNQIKKGKQSVSGLGTVLRTVINQLASHIQSDAARANINNYCSKQIQLSWFNRFIHFRILLN